MREARMFGKLFIWDEEAKCQTYNINDKSICLIKHDFVNASLHWSKVLEKGVKAHISLENRVAGPFTPQWGDRGGIRFCTRCKFIDCIHNWEPETPKDESWRNCPHDWIGGLVRSDNHNGAYWYCSKCGAMYRFMCGHGGSLYVCDPCYKASINWMIKEEKDLNSYLTKYCFPPEFPNIKICTSCKMRIKL